MEHLLQRITSCKSPVFVTGKAGTGKSTLLRAMATKLGNRCVVVAPTGIAAINVSGMTIHRFFGIRPNMSLHDAMTQFIIRERFDAIRALDTIIFDEVSMIRADLMDMVDAILRRVQHNNMPFGGKKVVFFGDLYQIPPVVREQDEGALFNGSFYKTPFFFGSMVISNLDHMEIIELDKVYRQSDERFIRVLNEIRAAQVSDESIEILNSRVGKSFLDDTFAVILTTTNQMADKINMVKLQSLKGNAWKFDSTVTGAFPEDAMIAPKALILKRGAKVMFLNNDTDGRWVNGSMGIVLDMDGNDIVVETERGEKVKVEKNTWDSYKITVENREITHMRTGSYRQYPLKLAWGMTIHKSQGKTFDQVKLDLSRGIFAPGQLYVALSRCTSLNGLILNRNVEKRHAFVSPDIGLFLENHAHFKPEMTYDEIMAVATEKKNKRRRNKVERKRKTNQAGNAVFPEFEWDRS
jgi:energy-coupling factor transporter ATP-binding protein EcfA2